MAEPEGAHHEESPLGWFWVGAVAVAVVVFPMWVVLTALLAEVQRPESVVTEEVAAETDTDARPPAPVTLAALEAAVIVAGALSVMGIIAGAGVLWPRKPPRRTASSVVMPSAAVTVRVRERPRPVEPEPAEEPGPSDDAPEPEEDLSSLFAASKDP